MSIFSSYLKIIDIEKNISGNIKKCASNFIRFVPKTKKRVFHIPDNYEVVIENSAQSCTALLEEQFGL